MCKARELRLIEVGPSPTPLLIHCKPSTSCSCMSVEHCVASALIAPSSDHDGHMIMTLRTVSSS